MSWARQIAADRQLLARARAGRATSAFAAAAARLADARDATDLDRLLATSSDGDAIEMAVARGRRALVHERIDDAVALLARAQSLATSRAPLLVGRIAFLLGAIHLGRDEEVATDAVLAWAEGLLGREADASADVLHLRALLAERRGERDLATQLYRRVLQRASLALTPMTRVLAMRNLAATLAHSYPRESTGLYAMALATLDADELDPATRSTIDNGMGYALLCAGEVEGARLKLHQAKAEARRLGNERVDVYASFNLAIADELSGDMAAADEQLRAVAREAHALGLVELVGWTSIRRSWLQLRSGSAADAARLLRELLPSSPRTEHRDAVFTLKALIHLADRDAPSRAQLERLAKTYAGRGDLLTQFTLLLWVAYANTHSGRAAAARRAVASACALGAEHGFRLGTSWWSPELAAVAREHASPEHIEYADRLVTTGASARADERPAVVITSDGGIGIAGRPLEEAAWREGRSGSGVLRRFFRAVLSAYPAGLGRDELADLLWPESDGDKAVRNLYDATKDLRHVLARVPGAQLEVSEGRYALAFEPNVTVAVR